MSEDIFRVDFYPHRAHAKYMSLKGEEIAMLSQIINLIYMNGGPIANDGRYLSQSIYDFGTAKCNRLVKILLEKEHIFITDDNRLGQVMALKQLNLVRDRSETRAKAGRMGGKTQSKNEENQQLDLSNSTSTNTSTNTSIKPPTPLEQNNPVRDQGVFINGVLGGSYKVENLLSENSWQDARAHAPGWDIHRLAQIYNEGINSGKREKPKYPNKAFPVWCKAYTKGNPPS